MTGLERTEDDETFVQTHPPAHSSYRRDPVPGDFTAALLAALHVGYRENAFKATGLTCFAVDVWQTIRKTCPKAPMPE